MEGLSSCYCLNKVSVKNYSFRKEQLLTVVSLAKKLLDNFTKTLFFCYVNSPCFSARILATLGVLCFHLAPADL